MRVTLDIGRFNPDAPNAKPYRQEFILEVEEYYTVLDSLIYVREYEDPTLAVRCSCRASICGSCAMRVNGHASLGCKTKLISVMDKDGRVRVDPVGNMPRVKDLVWDMKPFWDKIRAVDPFLQPEGPEPEEEYIASPESMLHLVGVMGCIMCGACVSDCTVLEVDENFLGPAALAKAYRFTGDPRDGKTKERLKELNEYSGIWDCTRCMECVQACPKGVAPMERIMALRDKTIAAGIRNTNGARHAEAVSDFVKKSGKLDELRLVPRTYGMFNPMSLNSLFAAIPVGLRALRRGKLPPIIPHKVEGKENLQAVRRIFDKVEGKK
ncbi:MAG: succinate dehydrogenase iron-sulfur subunit [Chloroflexi bacterium]|nr:succinate dehydrogenase iron-sulfur subunit [Chloroflexota bacterium]